MTVFVAVILEPEVEGQPGGQPHLGLGADRGHHGGPSTNNVVTRGSNVQPLLLLQSIVIQERTKRNFIDEDVDQCVGTLANLKI